jgi:hypothetical protein
MFTIAFIVIAVLLILCGAMPHMARPRRPNTNVYRQQDPNVLRSLGQPINANIQSITLDPLDTTYVYIYFDAPVVQVGGTVTVPDWTINGHGFGGGVDFSADSRVMHLKMAAVIEVGNACVIEPTIETDGFRPLTGGLINGFFGTVQTNPTGDTFNITSITAADTTHVDIEFDAPVAITAAGYQGPGSSGLQFDTNIPLTEFVDFIDDNIMRFITDSSVTSGMAWELVAPDIRQWVSIGGAQIVSASGTIDPA